ncbi:hypothetical protein A0256_08885 [Mucilaginibacter sp. PAMC 26640]|nr:hypothetical protein A0256_08885 [Mucilaginibacter sp. PAMC 26640]
MKQFFLTFLAILFYWSAFAQSQQAYLNHQNYDVLYSVDKHVPLTVVYMLRKTDPSAVRIPRPTHFAADPQVPGSNFSTAYLKAGYDKGHMMSAASNQFDPVGMKESFLFTNVTPQKPRLNRGNWKAVETLERKLRDDFPYVKVICGNILSEYSSSIVNGTIGVPDYCWKVLITPATALKLADTLCYLFPNTSDLEGDIDKYKTGYKELEPDMPYKLNELIGMYECPDADALQNYMASMLQVRLNLQYKSDIDVDEVIDRYKYRFKDDEGFRKEMEYVGVKVSEGISIEDYARDNFTKGKADLENEYSVLQQGVSALKTPQSFLDLLSNPAKTLSKVGICPICHLPMSFPFCLVPRPR